LQQGGIQTMTNNAVEYVEDQIQKCIKHIDDSYNPPTRYKWMAKQSMFEHILDSLRSYESVKEELQIYRQMERRCRDKYGCSIAKQLGL